MFPAQAMARELAGHFGRVTLTSRSLQWDGTDVCDGGGGGALGSCGRQARTRRWRAAAPFAGERSRSGALQGGLARSELLFAGN